MKYTVTELAQAYQEQQKLVRELSDAHTRIAALETELDRFRALRADIKTIILYLPGAVDEALAGSERHFTRDAVAEAGARILEAVADD